MQWGIKLQANVFLVLCKSDQYDNLGSGRVKMLDKEAIITNTRNCCHRVCRTDLNAAKQCLIYAVNCVTLRHCSYITLIESHP